MQPYFFPYLGYFQLISSVDKFVFYDDVSFIKQGWINRNVIQLNKQPHLISVPVSTEGIKNPINKVRVVGDKWPHFRTKLKKKLQQAYSGAPEFKRVYPMVESVLDLEVNTIDQLACSSVKQVMHFLGVNSPALTRSSEYENGHLSSHRRVLDICMSEGTDQYINLPGGRELYDKKVFADNNIQLRFLRPYLPIYEQNNNEFLSRLSIIDVLMFNRPIDVIDFFSRFTLES